MFCLSFLLVSAHSHRHHNFIIREISSLLVNVDETFVDIKDLILMESCCRSLLLVLFALSFLFLDTHQLPSSQIQVLLQLRKHLEYPTQLETWTDHTVDFCSTSSSSPQVNITCINNLVVELRIKSDKPFKASVGFHGGSVSGLTLSESFLLDSFVTNLVRLNSLKVLSLVSLGIWGQLPDKIHRLSSLESLDLSSNFLFGSIPPRMSSMVKLQSLVMEDNYLNGTFPDWFGSLSNLSTLSFRNNKLRGALVDLSKLGSLEVLDLSLNKLNGVLPSMPKGLAVLSLSGNGFSGEIPQQYRKLSVLQRVDMSSNALTGTPLAALFSLPNISYLNLASNLLSGTFPGHLSCGVKLDYINVSNNSLTGDLPSCLGAESDNKIVKFGGNCLSSSMQNQHPESFCSVAISAKGKESQHKGKEVAILVGVVIGILVLLVLIVLSCILLCRRYLPRGVSEQHLLHKPEQEPPVAVGFSTEMLTNARYISQAAKAGMLGLPGCRAFSLEELVDITRNFDNSAFLGEGSYGKLYKGKLQNGIQVVIRCLLVSKKYTIRNLKLRLDLLSKLRHPHLVCLLGHCLDGGGDDYSVNKVYLVSEYVSNGTFRAKLSGKHEKVLNWSRRLSVLIGVAKAVHFLHTGIIPGFLSNRLKMNNILLNEHDNGKLSDYGLSIISEDTDMANDGHKSWQMKSLEDDAYSFGYILLEAIVGASISARRESFQLNDMASLNTEEGRKQLVEPIVLATCSPRSLSIVISIMCKCISPEASRPSFEDILWNLQYAVQVQATADGDNRYDTSSHR